MPILPHEDILKLHRAIISAQLVPSRAALLTGVDEHLVAGLPIGATPSDQILQDLDALNKTQTLADGTVPLAWWLQNAVARTTGKKEAKVFQDALERCDAGAAVEDSEDSVEGKTLSEQVGMGTPTVLLSITRTGSVTPAQSRRPTLRYAHALSLIRTELPRALLSNGENPYPILVRAGIEIETTNNASPLDQWTVVCDALARRSIMGVVETLRLIREAQRTRFSHETTQCAARLIEALLAENGGQGGDGDLMLELKALAIAEAAYWRQFYEEVARLHGTLGDESRRYAEVMVHAWASLSLVLAGPRAAQRIEALLVMELDACNSELHHVQLMN